LFTLALGLSALKLSSEEIDALVVTVAKEKIGHNIFRRRRLMVAAEEKARQLGVWSPEDDALSRSVGAKSVGLANIDWAITRQEGKGLRKAGRDQWQAA
jgi:hypothetical protein